jgi:hypothetical protein
VSFFLRVWISLHSLRFLPFQEQKTFAFAEAVGAGFASFNKA